MENTTNSILIGNRIPKDYFVTMGSGSSDIAYHAGAYHLMLKEAGIEMMNIMTYSSILPAEATEITKPELIKHGCVGECILSTTQGNLNDSCISAGIIYGWLYNRQTGEKFGGLVCENGGSYNKEDLSDLLHASLNELYINGFKENYILTDINIHINSTECTKKYNCTGVALVFTNYIVPILN